MKGRGLMLIKRILATVSAITVLACSIFIVDADNEHIKSGMCGENVRWSFDTTTGIITISGTGDMYTYGKAESWGYHRYRNEIKKVIIEEGITSIGSRAFYEAPLSGDLVLPKTLNYIANEAFTYTNITSVNLNEGMYLGGQSFAYINSLKEVTIPKDLIYMLTPASNAMRDNAAFIRCESLEKVIIKGGGIVDFQQSDPVQNGIGGDLFADCKSLKDIIIDSRDIEYVDLVTYHADGVQQGGTFWLGNNPTFYIYKNSTTEATLRKAGYFRNASVQYIARFSKLETAISEAEGIETEKYTEESVAKFTEALETGKAILEDLTSTQEEVDNAVKAIKEAKNALEEKKEEPSESDPTEPSESDPSNSSDNNNQSPNTPATSAPTTAKPKPTTPPTVKTPAKIKTVKLKAKKKKLKVSWKKVSGAVGYEVQASTKKKFKKNVISKATAKNKLVFKKLKSKKKYFVRVRAYKKSNGNVYYGKWSKVVKKKVR